MYRFNMRGVSPFLFGSIFSLLILFGVGRSVSAKERQVRSEETIEVIVTLSDDVKSPESRAKSFIRNCTCQVKHIYEHTLKGFAVRVSKSDFAQVLQKSWGVDGIYMDRKLETISSRSKSLENKNRQDDENHDELHENQKVPVGVQRIGGDVLSERGFTGQGVNVAIIDSGIDRDHPDLKNNVKGGRNFATDDPDDWDDYNGHGSHVAGIVAAENNEIGVAGVAPDANLYGVRVLEKHAGKTSAIIAGVEWVGSPDSPDIHVANMSLGGPAFDDREKPLRKAIQGAVDNGVTFSVAAGNADQNAKGFIPSKFDEVITVGATADTDGEPGGEGPVIEIPPRSVPGGPVVPGKKVPDDSFAPFSNFGKIDLVAPGMEVVSTWKNGEYNEIDGTSMASPLVGGAAAVLIGRMGTRSPDRVERILQSTAESAPGCSNDQQVQTNSGNQDCGWEGYPEGVKNEDVPLVRPDKAVKHIRQGFEQ